MSTVLGLIGIVVYIPAILVAARRHVRRREALAEDDGRSGQGEGLDRRVPRTIVTVAAATTAFAAIGVCAGGTGTRTAPTGTIAFTCGNDTRDDDICTIGAGGKGLRRVTAGPGVGPGALVVPRQALDRFRPLDACRYRRAHGDDLQKRPV